MDKPWLGRYSNRPDADFELHATLYNTYANVARHYPDDIAVVIEDTREKYTHREFLELVDTVSDGFRDLGIRDGSKVGIILNGFVEDAATLFALNKIGAVGKYIDFMKSLPSIKHSVEETPLDALIIDECFLPLEQAVNERHILTVVGNTVREYSEGHYKSYPKKNAKASKGHGYPVPYVKDKPCVIISSSGTTGEPKPIMHSDYGVNAAAQKMMYTDYPITRGNVITKMIPSQVGLGLILSLYAGLIGGATVVMFSACSTDNLVGKLVSFTKGFRVFLKDHNLNPDAKLNIITAPIFVRALVRYPEKIDLSIVGSLMGDGSKMSAKELDEMLEIARSNGLKCPICNGYGQNELAAGPVTINCNQYNINGSAGFPTYKTDIIIVNPDTLERLDVNEIGWVLESSNSEFLCYDGLPQQTENARVTLADGTRWFNSYDLGYMDEEGFLFIVGRTSRVVIREDHKISLDEVEQKIRGFSFIEDCATIVSKQGGSVEEFVAFIVSNSKDAVRKIKESNSLHEYETPSEFIVVDSLPYKTQGKIDYQLLQKNYQQQFGS